jgi:hypothetical protein
MGKVIHTLAAAPILTLLVGVAFLLVGGLLLSAWTERRRQKQLNAIVTRARRTPPQPPPPALLVRRQRLLARSRTALASLCNQCRHIAWSPLLLTAACAMIAVVAWWRSSGPETPPPSATRRPSATTPTGNDVASSAAEVTLTLWYTNFSTAQAHPADIYAAPVRLWGIDSDNRSPAPITVTSPSQPATNWQLADPIDQSRIDAIHPGQVPDYSHARKLFPTR